MEYEIKLPTCEELKELTGHSAEEIQFLVDFDYVHESGVGDNPLFSSFEILSVRFFADDDDLEGEELPDCSEELMRRIESACLDKLSKEEQGAWEDDLDDYWTSEELDNELVASLEEEEE